MSLHNSDDRTVIPFTISAAQGVPDPQRRERFHFMDDHGLPMCAHVAFSADAERRRRGESVTADLDIVTCQTCRRTKQFQNALEGHRLQQAAIAKAARRGTAYLYGKAYASSRSHYSTPFMTMYNVTHSEVDEWIRNRIKEGKSLYQPECVFIDWHFEDDNA